MTKRFCSLLLCLCMVVSMLAGTVSAAGEPIGPIADSGRSFGLLSADPTLEIGAIGEEAPTLNEPAYRTSTSSAGTDLRNAMKNRQATVEVGLRTTSASEEELEYWAYDILAWAVSHTGVGDEGDYLSMVSAVESISVDGYAEGSYAYLTYTYTLIYASTAAQEKQVTQKVQTVLSQLDVSDADDLTKAAALYDYICSTVTYTGIPTESSPDADFMAYGALVNGKANSYGFAHLFYRLALELGLDCRIIAGEVNGNDALWNIVLVDMYYYNVDAALDAGKAEYSYFLKSDEGCTGHLRYEEFATEEFYEYYPMDPVDYDGEEIAVDGGTCGEGVEWVIGHRGTLIIYGNGPMDHYTEEGMGYNTPKTVPWYNYKEYIRVIIVDEGVTTIGRGSFNSCHGLHTVAIAGTVETLTEYAFSNCDLLTTVILSEGLTAIDTKAFSSCSNLAEITLPSTVQSIGYQAFYLTDLKSIVIPAAVTFIDEDAFESCYELEEIIVEEGNKAYTSVDGVLYDKAVTHLIKCPEGKVGKLVIPDSVVSMVDYSAAHTNYLTDVVIGNGMEIIPEGAFWYSNLTGVTIGTGVKEIHAYAFENCRNLTTIRFQGSAPEIEWYALSNVRNATAYYPAGDPTWTEEVMHQGGSGITWVAECANHKIVLLNAKEATCTEDGYTGDEGCATCGEIVTAGSVIPALGHNYGKPAYLGREDGHRYTCSRCGEAKIEACSFDAVTVVKEATLHNSGIKKHSCTACGGSYEAAYQYRISGSGRVETGIEVANQLKAVLGVEKFDAIIIANGDNFADALAGSYLASAKGAPILLHRNSGAGDNLNEAYIAENLEEGGTVYLLGGNAAIPDAIEENFTALGYKVVRLSGDSRFLTNLAILEEAGVAGKEILICTGWNYADSLSASATGLPILMLNTVADKLTAEQIAFLEANAGNKFTIIGGVSAVSSKLESDIAAIVGDVDRIYGDSREATSVAVAQRYVKNPATVLIAYSRNFPDGLCGGPLAYAMKAPLLLINSKKEADAAAYVSANGIARGIVLGGTAAVTEASVTAIFGE